MYAERKVIGPGTAASVKEGSLVAKPSSRNTPSSTEVFSASTGMSINGHEKGIGGEDVSLKERRIKDVKVRDDFEDVFRVRSNCESFIADLSNYTDEVDLAGSLSLQSSVLFFEALGH